MDHFVVMLSILLRPFPNKTEVSEGDKQWSMVYDDEGLNQKSRFLILEEDYIAVS